MLIGICTSFWVEIIVADPEVVRELFIDKNKFIDKDDIMKILFYDILGESMGVSTVTDDWNTRRKILSSAFYKEKL
jgi:hypothetical protein